MTTNVSAENEDFLRQAIAEGRFANWDEAINLAVHRLREDSYGHDQVVQASGSVEEWIANLRAWAGSHRRVEHPVDYDRDAIYSGRGE
jgi:Arc/MetJ-type ribon-helix-helix transcriptional regulator